jgi:isopenicillin N synthase-like dioxygenase
MSEAGHLNEVPAIDLEPSFAGGNAGRDKVAAEIRHACEEIGFFSVVGHHVPDKVVETLRSEAMSFFARPPEDKLKTPQPPEKISRGYSHVGSRGLAFSLGKETPPDLQESFAMGPIKAAPPAIAGTQAERLFFFPNLWPTDRPQLRSAFEAYYGEMDKLALHILRLFARALNLDDHFFDGKVKRDKHDAGDLLPAARSYARTGAASGRRTYRLRHADYPERRRRPGRLAGQASTRGMG